MNPNIKQINEHIVSLNYEQVKAGLLHGITLIETTMLNEPDGTNIASISTDGLIVLNNRSNAYLFAEFMFVFLQLDNDYDLKRKLKHFEQKLKEEASTAEENICWLFLNWEIRRREVFKKYKQKRR